MKKQLFLLAAPALLLAACAQNEVLETALEGTPQPVEFATYVGGANTRAGINLNKETLKSFGAFAQTQLNGTETDHFDFMFNQEVKKNTSTNAWEYSPLKYWPNQDGKDDNGSEPQTDKVKFYAYAPYADNGTVANTYGRDAAESNGITLNSTTKNDALKTLIDYAKPATGHTDVLWATPVDFQVKQEINDKVKFTFNHAMSRIGSSYKTGDTQTAGNVKVRYLIDQVNAGGTVGSAIGADNDPKDADETRVVLKKVTIWVQDRKTGETTASTDFYKNGTLDFSNGTWSNTTTSEEISTEALARTAGLWEEFTLANGDDKSNLGGTGKNLVSNKNRVLTGLNGIIAMPTSGEAYIYATVDYYVITKDSKLGTANLSSITGASDDSFAGSSIHNTITNYTTVQFESGKDYTVNLVLGLTSVKMEIDVNAWEVKTGKGDGGTPGSGDVDEIDLPKND